MYAIINWTDDGRLYTRTNKDGTLEVFATVAEADEVAESYVKPEQNRVISIEPIPAYCVLYCGLATKRLPASLPAITG